MGCSRAARLLSMLFLIAAAQKSIASFTGAYMVRMVVELPYDEAGFTSAVQGSFRQAVATATTTTADAVTVNSFAAAAIGRRRLLVAGIDVDFSIAKESEGMAMHCHSRTSYLSPTSMLLLRALAWPLPLPSKLAPLSSSCKLL